MKSYQLKKMNEIATYYFIYKNQFNVLSFSSGDYDYSSPYYQYYRNVEIAFSHLDEDEKLIVINEFFESTRADWWKKHYTRKEFIVNKNKAVEHFLRYFNESN